MSSFDWSISCASTSQAPGVLAALGTRHVAAHKPPCSATWSACNPPSHPIRRLIKSNCVGSVTMMLSIKTCRRSSSFHKKKKAGFERRSSSTMATVHCNTSDDEDCEDEPTESMSNNEPSDQEEQESCCASSRDSSKDTITPNNQAHPPSQKDNERKLAFFTTWEDWEVGKLLGSGSFASVYQVKPASPPSSLVNNKKDDFMFPTTNCDTTIDLQENGPTSILVDEDLRSASCSTTDQSSSSSLTSTSTPTITSPTNQVYALKTLNPEFLDDQASQDYCCNYSPQMKQAAKQGLQLEAQLLSELPRHENIIALVGLSAEACSQQQDPRNGATFLVLERLTETLDQRIRRWKMYQRVEQSNSKGCLFGLGSLLKQLCHHRKKNCGSHDPVAREQHLRVAQVGLGVARAMHFLHKNHIR